MIGISMFSSAGIGETFLEDINVKIVAANELLEKEQIYIKKYIQIALWYKAIF